MKAKISWLLIGNVVFTVAQFVRLIVVARHAGAGAVGDFTLATAVATPVMMLAQFRLREVAMTDAAHRFSERSYLWLTALAGVGGLVAAALVALLMAASVEPSTGNRTMLFVLTVVVALGRFFESFSLTLYGFGQRAELMRSVGISTGLRAAFGSALFAVVFLASDSLVAASIGVTGANAVFVLIDRHMFWRSPSARPIELKGLFVLALPLGITSLLLALTDTVPRLVLAVEATQAEVGIFGAFGYAAAGATLVVRSIGHAAGPGFGRSVASNDWVRFKRQVRSASHLSVVAAALAIGAGAVAGRRVLDFTLGAEFGAEWRAFLVVVVYGALLMLATPWQTAMVALSQTGRVLFVQVVTVAVVAASSLMFLPGLGIEGAAFALLAGGLSRFALSWIFVSSFLRASA